MVRLPLALGPSWSEIFSVHLQCGSLNAKKTAPLPAVKPVPLELLSFFCVCVATHLCSSAAQQPAPLYGLEVRTKKIELAKAEPRLLTRAEVAAAANKSGASCGADLEQDLDALARARLGSDRTEASKVFLPDALDSSQIFNQDFYFTTG